MITLISTLGSSLTLYGLMLFHFPKSHPVDSAIQFTLIIAPCLLISILFFLSITKYLTQFTNRMRHPINRYLSMFAMLAFFALPNGKRLLLNDLVFTIACVVTVWCWLSWGFFMKKRVGEEVEINIES
ncbi:MAG: hypothetical protein QE487_01800 [Fluviicola sp.]|nr:hypothetical protein [Fluviicola sp.]